MSAISQASSTIAHCAVDPASVAGELKIRIFDSYVRYSGSSAQLIAEGLIPPGFTWPEGRRYLEWPCGGNNFLLCRTRPDDVKGPMSVWANGDHWSLSVTRHGEDWQQAARRKIERKARALREEARFYTTAGRREYFAAFDRYRDAQKDPAYQAFKTRVPALVPAKRGRPAKGGVA